MDEALKEKTKQTARMLFHTLKDGVGFEDWKKIDKGQPAHRGDFVAQARAVFRAVKAQVEAGGGTMASIVKINTYLTDIRHRAELVPVREEFFGKKGPASTLVAVAALAQPDWLIEVEAIAVV